MTMPTAGAPAPPALPSHEDRVVRGASTAIGGPVGRHALLGGRWARLPVWTVLALTCVTLLLGWVQKAPCRVHPWTSEYQYTRMCYSDVFALYFAEGLADGKTPYADHPVEYPVVIGGLMEAGAKLAAHWPKEERPRRFFDLTSLMLAGCGLVMVATTLGLAGRRRPWDAAMVALAPVLVLHAYTNWDLAAAALTGLGLLAWARRRPGWAGVWLGLGTATKLYPVLLLVPLFLLCLRMRRLPEFRRTALAAAAAWLVVDLPVWVAYPDSFGRFFALNRTRGADWDSLWFGLQHLRGRALDVGLPPGAAPTVLNAVVAGGFLLALVGIAALALRAPVRPRLAQLVFLTLVAFLISNKVFSPQYSIWLLPLAVLARPRWPAFLAWQASELFLLFLRFYFFVGQDKPGTGVPTELFLTGVLLRDVTLLLLAALVVRDVLVPAGDVVRRSGYDDPTGGVLVTEEQRSGPARRRLPRFAPTG
ncbi:MAG: glycosyltransferase family 87 protein [Mycobacteriales bacterium]